MLNIYILNVSATGYESDSGVSRNSSLSSDTDHTYIPSSVSTVDSYSTCYSWQSSHTTLTDELSEIRGATPLKQLAQQIEAWTKTGSYRSLSPCKTVVLTVIVTFMIFTSHS